MELFNCTKNVKFNLYHILSLIYCFSEVWIFLNSLI